LQICKKSAIVALAGFGIDRFENNRLISFVVI